MLEKRPSLQVKISAIERYFIWHLFSNQIGHVRVTEFPKSGGTWLCQMLAQILHLPYPRNKRIGFKPAIFHSHYSSLPRRQPTIVLLRDGRDVLVSAYFHFLLSDPKGLTRLGSYWRAKVPFSDFESIEQNLPAFIETFHQHFSTGGRNQNWANFYQSLSSSKSQLIWIKYEDLKESTFKTLETLLTRLNPECTFREDEINKAIWNYSFENQTHRKPGMEDSTSFLRKGIVGDWKNKFTKEAGEVFNELYGEVLIKLGYENDSTWLLHLE